MAKIRQLQEENATIREERSRAEGEIRKELVTKWSTREEDQEVYYQERIRAERKQVEDIYLKRMDMLERLLERTSQKKLDDLRQEKENELEKQREELVNVNLELRRAQEECKAMAAKLEEARACRVGAEEALMSSTVMTFANPVKVMRSQRLLRDIA